MYFKVSCLSILYKNKSLLLKKQTKSIEKTYSNIFIGYGHFRMFQVYRATSKNDCCSVLNRRLSSSHWYRSCHIAYDNKHVYTTGKPSNFEGSEERTLLKRNQKLSDLYRLASDCMVNTRDVCCAVAGTRTMA